MSIENTLKERGNRYGDFADRARLCQDLKKVMAMFAVVQAEPNGVAVHYPWEALPATHKQSLEVIADKIARILSGDPSYADNWHDIQGYAKLVEDRLPPAAEIEWPADDSRVDIVASSHGDGEHYDDMSNPANWLLGDALRLTGSALPVSFIGGRGGFTTVRSGSSHFDVMTSDLEWLSRPVECDSCGHMLDEAALHICQ